MAPAKATVFGGNNLGEGTVLGSGLNRNINLIARANKQVQDNEKFQQEQLSKLRKENKKRFQEFADFNPQSEYLPYVDPLAKEVANFRNKSEQVFIQSGGFPSEEQQTQLAKDRALIETRNNKIKLTKEAGLNQLKLAQKDDEVNDEFVSEFIGNAPFDDKGKVIDIDKFNPKEMAKWTDKAEAYNVPVQAENFADSVEEEIRSQIKRNGDTFDEVTTKSKFISGINPTTNETQYNITPELANLWKRKHGRKITLQAEVEKLKEEGIEGSQGELERVALEGILHGQGVFEERINRQNAPRDNSRGSGRSFDDLEIVASNDFELENLENAKNGIVGASGLAVETPNLIKDIEFNPNELSTVQGFGVDNNGDFVIRTTTKKGSNIFSSKNVKASQNNLSKVRNGLKNADERASFDRLVSRFRKELKNNKALEVDETKLNSFVDEISSEISNSTSDTEGQAQENIRKKLLDLGLESQVDVNIPGNVVTKALKNPKLKIDGVTYDLKKNEDVDKLKKLIFNSTKNTRQFVKEVGDQPIDNPKGKKPIPGF